MSDYEKKTPLRDHAKTLLKMDTEAKRVQRRIGANAVIIIAVFEDENKMMRVQDAGMFPMPPDQFYGVMQQAHINGQMSDGAPKIKPTSRIMRPH